MKLKPLRCHAGFTLVELMVAVAIGLFLLTIIVGIYVTGVRNFTSTNAVTGLDENARAIFDLIGTNVRQSGFNGCGRLTDGGIINGDTRTTILVRDPTNINANPVNPTLWWTDTTAPVQGATLASADSRFPNSHPANLLPAGSKTDVLMLVGVDSQNVASVVANPANPNITTGAHKFTPGQMLLASSCQLNSFFVASAGTGGSQITHTMADNCDTNLAGACATGGPAVAVNAVLPDGALILPVVATAYYVAPSSTAGKGNSLWSCTISAAAPPPLACTSGNAATELVNGVENMALSFGLDTSTDSLMGAADPTRSLGLVNPIGSADTWANPDNVTNWSRVVAVRVTLLLATMPDVNSVTTGNNAYTFNGSASVTPTDRRVYRQYTATFSVRNRTF